MMERDYYVLCENIKKKMNEKNVTVRELADRCGITSVSLCRYINGNRVPKAALIFDIARELDCTADELMGIEGQEQPDPCEPTIQSVIKWLKSRAQNVTMAGARKMFQTAAVALEKQELDRWIPVTERLPRTTDPVNVTWVNNDPVSYYEDIKGKRFTATAHYHRGKWWWYSSVCQDLLDEYGKSCMDDEVYEGIEILAWRPLPEPYTEEEA